MLKFQNIKFNVNSSSNLCNRIFNVGGRFLTWLFLLQIYANADRISLLPSSIIGFQQFNNINQQNFNLNQPCDKNRKVFTENVGEISDGPTGVNYTQDSHCEWLIKAQNSSQFITLTFNSMATECSYDYIYVYDGDSFNSTLLGSFSGRTEPQRLVAKSGNMLILLYSDTNYVLDGFRATYYISNCLNNCHGNGKCVGHQCVCHGEWIGADCEELACPEHCGEEFGRAKCVNGLCKCKKGFSGRLCDLSVNPEGEHWRWLATSTEGMTARAAHSAIYLEEQDSLYVFGGYDLNYVLSALQIYRFKKSRWEDEWGIPLQNRQNYYRSPKIDYALLKAVLSNTNDDEAKLWGLKNDASFFSNILYTIAESNFVGQRKHKRSPLPDINANITNKEISDLIDDLLENVIDDRPKGRYGHAAEKIEGGFVIFGGKFSNGNFSNELWFYNVSGETSGKWTLRAQNSIFKPPTLARHTLTLANNYLYVFGGTLNTGEFSSRIFRIKLLPNSTNEQWEEIHPHGGKSLDVRLVAHSTIYYRYTNSLIIYGGIMASLARFSKLSDRIYSFQLDKNHWTEILYPRTALRDTNIPRERAFHSATIAGNYMIIFGGYTHRHNKEEICYDNQMYLYHLGCHTWINQEIPSAGYQYPKKQGVFAHAVAVRNSTTLLIVGGYHGNVNSDLFAYELPQILRAKDPENYNPEESCRFHQTQTSCLSDPECGWCSADSSCYGRTIGANCTTNLQTTRCPGICPSLDDCHSCLVHGTLWSVFSQSYSIASKLGLNQCTWCVQNARCHHKDNNYGVCGETESQIPGWWGSKGNEISSPLECTKNDRRPGLTYIKYNYPVNLTMPDSVSIVNATMVDFASASSQSEHGMAGEMIARLLGFVRPPKSWNDLPNEMLQICTSYATATLRSGIGENLDSAKDVANLSAYKTTCKEIEWPSLTKRFIVDFQARRKVGMGGAKEYQKTNMELQHYNLVHMNSKAFTFEYLEPFSFGNCPKYTNCLQCLTDSMCGWCDLTNKCLSRSVNETIECSSNNGSIWNYITIQPAQCANCSNYIACDECINTGICEWWSEESRCSRIGRSTIAIRFADKCPTPCRLRKSCNACLDEKGRCVWCESSAQCFSFSIYTSEFQFGMCREWLDRALPTSLPTGSLILLSHGAATTTSSENNIIQNSAVGYTHHQKCKTCTQHLNCSTCLQTLSCGWCFDRDYPIEGVCMQGDFSKPFGNCGFALNTSEAEAEWAYAQCPDVDECGLKLDDCHKEAKCTNTYGSFNCHCRRGYIGDGRVSCIRTCFDLCVHGQCSGSPDYQCRCDLGWTGIDCSINCGCHNHSTCDERVGKCDKCLKWTEGDKCERCRPGSYGNATSNEGCAPCECNGHGNQDLGICDSQNGECFCKDNTGGLKCEVCNAEYYGEPKEGGQCFFQCESRGMLTEIGRQGIGSRQSYKNPWGGPEVRECLWLITPKPVISDPLIQIEIDWETLNVQCDENAVYIYDSLPDLAGSTQQSQLIAVVCSPYSNPQTIETRSIHLTVHYKQGGGSKDNGFNALYNVRSCNSRTCLTPHICDEKERCVCPPGFVGSKCDIEICPKNCTSKFLQGVCDKSYGRCICQAGFAGADCSVRIKPNYLVINDLFNTLLLSESFDHLRKTIPRFGHSLSADKRGSLWMFGGYSLSNGPLNDIRQFDTKNGTWMQVTVESTPDAKMPLGRYFHGAEIYSTKQIIYIYGGLTSHGKTRSYEILNDFWQFSIQNQRWNEIKINSLIRPPQLAGHTLTFIKMYDKESLLLIGGLSTENSSNLQLWEYSLDLNRWEKLESTGVQIPALYGHSTVYHSPSQFIYVFGGYANEIQKKLYALNMQSMQWTELPAFTELNSIENMLPRSRYFHSAVTTDSYMIVYGGRSSPYNATDNLIAYVYECNQWIRLTEDVHIVGKLPDYTYAEAITIDPENKVVYLVGGWDGSSQSRVIKITLPEDICQLWSASKYFCRHYMGCSYCGVTWNDETTSYCYSNDNREICETQNGTVSFNNGASCDDAWMSLRNCSTFLSCSSCLASWPSHTESISSCQWCDGCGIEGKCLPNGAECERGTAYCKKHTSVESLEKCPSPQCHTLNCASCFLNENCQWAVNDVRVTECITKDLVERNNYKVVNECPASCYKFTNCSSCLDIEIENPKLCKWSTSLQTCIDPKTQPLYCAGGVCGLLIDPKEKEHCPEPCQAYTQCSTCSRHAHCGWCSRDNKNGEGVCTEGSSESLSAYQLISTCDVIYADQKNLTLTEINSETFSWNYISCPAEDECSNHHHNCDPISQKCVDSTFGYNCVCGEGYKEENNVCVPVCLKGCVRGQCIKPDSCLCDFGYVGENCSIQCQCNGHSDCAGPDKLADCLQCHNNTMGEQCEKCKPLFVGNPKDNGKCVPCLEHCNGHTDICVSDDAESHIKNMTRLELESFLKEGPITNATCLRCSNKTAGDRCDTCILGFFRGSDNESDPCRLCECHGHGDICDPITGEKCNCGNNTESDATCIAGNIKNSAQPCWSSQCSKCRDSYAGTPIDGHQCYKQISVEVRMCFDALPIEQCKLKPSPLRPGQTVFFVIQPRFMNVDIRVIIDVTQGELDVFMSPQEDSFVVQTNQTTGHHHLYLDNKYLWETDANSDLLESLNIAEAINYKNVTPSGRILPDRQKLFWTPSIRDCKSLDGKGFYVKDHRAKDLSTYITLDRCNTLLRLFNLKNRLVLTLPQNAHNLSATRFFIALRASPGNDHSYGSIVFRQDQLHIDLFVFFSVFFSCFFLFLAICVVAWKAKQAADLRRARRRHVVEMFQMAKRPFASIFVTLPTHQENENPLISSSPVLHLNRRSRGRSKSSATMSPLNTNSVRPVAIEPTVDNVAAVGTVFISLPGRHISPVSLALGSSLITLPRQYPLTTSRAFLRRRGSHSHPAIVQVQQQQALPAPQLLQAQGPL